MTANRRDLRVSSIAAMRQESEREAVTIGRRYLPWHSNSAVSGLLPASAFWATLLSTGLLDSEVTAALSPSFIYRPALSGARAEYSRGGHSVLSIHFFLTLSGEANTQIRCGRTGTSRHEDTAVAPPSDLPQTKQLPVLFRFKTTACFGGHKRPIKNFLNLMYVFARDLTYKVQSIKFPCTDFWSPYLVQIGAEIRVSVADIDTDSLLSQNWPPSTLVRHGSCKSCSETDSATTD